jgi:hypothetical protein
MSEEKKSEISINETIAVNRALPVVEASSIPLPSPGFRPTAIEIRRRQLRRIAAELESEVVEALREYATRGAEIAKTLGEKAPSAESAALLLSRLHAVQNSLTSVDLLRTYLAELEEIALSDSIEFLEKAKKRIDLEAADDPTLKAYHKRMLTFFEARGALISEGRTRAAEDREKKSEDV